MAPAARADVGLGQTEKNSVRAPSPSREDFHIVSHAAGFFDRRRQSEPFQGRGSARLDEVRAELLIAQGIAITLDQRDVGAGAAEEYCRRASGNTRSNNRDIVLGV